MYAARKSTVVAIAHEGIAILRERLVPEVILFPIGRELNQVMVDFEALCGLPCCGGTLDGTFMPIKKPADFGVTYFCYMTFTAIIVLACGDARRWSMHHHPIISKGDLFLVFHLISPRRNGAGDKQIRINSLGDRSESWTAVTTNELCAYMGCMILIGFIKLPSLHDYWKKDRVF